MKMHAIIAAEADRPDRPYLIDAWSEDMVNANPQGWRDNVARESIGVHAVRAVVIEVPDVMLLDLLYQPQPAPILGQAGLDQD